MALLENGFITIEQDSRIWFRIMNHFFHNCVTTDIAYSKQEIDSKLNILIPPLNGNSKKFLKVSEDETHNEWVELTGNFLRNTQNIRADYGKYILFTQSTTGVVLTDRTTGNQYLIEIDNGNIQLTQL